MEDEVQTWCTGAKRGCTECKQILAEKLLTHLEPIQSKRRELEKDSDSIWDLLNAGKKRAAALARQTMAEIKEIVF